MSLKSIAKKALLVSPPAYALYAVGGAVNSATGGKTETYNLAKALKGKGSKNTFSTTTQAFSGYQGAAPNTGKQGLPIVNPATPRVAGQIVTTVIREAAAPIAQETSKALFGVSLHTLAWVAGGSLVGLGGVYVATR